MGQAWLADALHKAIKKLLKNICIYQIFETYSNSFMYGTTPHKTIHTVGEAHNWFTTGYSKNDSSEFALISAGLYLSPETGQPVGYLAWNEQNSWAKKIEGKRKKVCKCIWMNQRNSFVHGILASKNISGLWRANWRAKKVLREIHENCTTWNGDGNENEDENGNGNGGTERMEVFNKAHRYQVYAQWNVKKLLHSATTVCGKTFNVELHKYRSFFYFFYIQVIDKSRP